jgi:hypothetical protein
MEPEQQPVEKTESPAEEKPISSGTRDNNRRGRDPRRPRFRRDDHGGRNDRGDRPRGDEGNRRPPGSIRDAMQHLEHIRNELRRVLDEMQEVARILDQAEREKTASEEEIERLRESLQQVQRYPGRERYPRSAAPAPRPTPAQEEAPVEEEPEREID